jgi:nucleotide-binding universal stress UspA family protein
MHVLVATDGSIDTDRAATFASALAGPDGMTTVATIVRVPRTLITDLRAQFGESPAVVVDADAEYVETRAGQGGTPRSWPGDDAVVAQYLGDKRVAFCRPIVEAIRAGGGTAESIVREGDDPADDIIALASELDAEVVVVGSHGHGAFQGLLGSTGSKLVRRSPCPVLVVR